MKIKKIKTQKRVLCPTCFSVSEGAKMPFFIYPDGEMEADSVESWTKAFEAFVDKIYSGRPKGYAVARIRDNFGYMLPSEAKEGNFPMYSKKQLVSYAKTNKLSHDIQTLEGTFWCIERDWDGSLELHKAEAAKGRIRVTDVYALSKRSGSVYETAWIGDNLYETSIKGVLLLKDWSRCNLLFSSEEVARTHMEEIAKSGYDSLLKIAQDGYAAICAFEKAEAEAKASAEEAERQAMRAAFKEAEAERLSKVNKDDLPVDPSDFVPGVEYWAYDNGRPKSVMYATNISGKHYGVCQIWEGSLYDENLTAYMAWVEMPSPAFSSWEDALDYHKLLKL